MNIVYLRVSKTNEEEQDPKQQLDAILDKYKIEDYTVYQERGSAYNLDKIKNRTEFFQILNVCFNAERTTIKDLFMPKKEKSLINLYVWDYSRIIRNIELNLIFSILSNMYNIRIHSFKDKSILKESDNETPTAKLTRIMMNTISAFSSEEYSYTISTNTKKAYRGDGFSKYGRQWGKGFNAVDGSKFKFESIEEYNAFKSDLKSKKKLRWTGEQIIEYTRNKHGLIITHSYISRNL